MKTNSSRARKTKPARRSPAGTKTGTQRRKYCGGLCKLVVFIVAAPLLILAAYRYVPPPATPLMLIRFVQSGERGVDYRWVPYEQISPDLARSVIAAEDNLFCAHSGFDVEALREQVERAMAGERPRGASTISQQLAKNLFLWPGRDPVRKGLEAVLTVPIEMLLSKKRILELYLNIVEFAPGVYGAEAASNHWFGVSADHIDSIQAAQLAVQLPNPRGRKPTNDNSVSRAQVVRTRIQQLGPLLDCATNG